MAWRRLPGKRPGYTLVELLVVLFITVLLTGMGIPNLYAGDSRYLLNNEAQKIKQFLDDARIRSQAPTKNDGQGAQVYQISLGPFPTSATPTSTAVGASSTNQIIMERGVASCASRQVKGSLTPIKSLQLSRGIYIDQFFPANFSPTDTQAVIRFAVGESGFRCGASKKPTIDSKNYLDPYWTGTNKAQARFAVIKLVSKSVGRAAYVSVDRLTGEVEIRSANPQSYFSAALDQFSPKWRPVPPAASPVMSAVCGSDSSTMSLSFARADDRYDANNVDKDRVVFYDIYAKKGAVVNAIGEYQPLFSKYFYDLTADQVIFKFRTDLITLTEQPEEFSFRLWAFDSVGNYQGSSPPADTSYQDLNFKKPDDWDCGGQISGSYVRHGATSDPSYVLGSDQFQFEVEPGANDLFFDPWLPPTVAPNGEPVEPVPNCLDDGIVAASKFFPFLGLGVARAAVTCS